MVTFRRHYRVMCACGFVVVARRIDGVIEGLKAHRAKVHPPAWIVRLLICAAAKIHSKLKR